jgi:phosphopantothenoylcysteine decarboxylase/phosphopantothenate--cysteine ligase
MAKIAHGLADDLLSVTALAARCPVVIAPAMDGGMYLHPATQANIQILNNRGVTIIEPDEGRFASGLVGKGRFPETPRLLGEIRRVLGWDGALVGRKVIVTAGGTREPIDPVRHITNRSSGKQGIALAQAAIDAGADVTLISTARDLPIPVGAIMIPVNTAEQMAQAVQTHCVGADALIMAAAVADFRPATTADQKIKKSDENNDGLTLVLSRTPDILQGVKAQRITTGFPRVVVGFAAESRDLLANAQAKLERKGVDLIVANDISSPDAGFEVDTNRVILMDARGGRQPIELATKVSIAEIVIQRVAQLLIQ